MTVKDYIEKTYEEPYRSQIIENAESYNKETLSKDIEDLRVIQPHNILISLFIFNGSPQGREYWFDYWHKLEKDYERNNS